MTKSVKAVKPMMTLNQAVSLDVQLNCLGYDLCSVATNIKADSEKSKAMYRRMIAVADALYKAAGAK